MAEYYRNAWYAQLQKKVAELEEEIRKAIELPTVSAADEGKVLTVDSDGKWDAEDVPKELPTVTSADEGKVLTVDSEGKWDAEDVPKELPTVTSADEGKVLTVDNNGDWGADNVPSGYNYSTTEQVVGTWIDDKPLYRKTIFKNYNELTTYGVRKGINIGEVGIRIHKIDACAFSSTYGYCPLGSNDYEADNSDTPYFACNIYYGNVVLEHSNGLNGLDLVQPNLSVTIYYTKTTD